MNYQLNPYTILPLFSMVLSIICGVFVLKENSKATLNRLFFAICLTFAAWLSFHIPYNINYTDKLLINWYKISYVFISFIPVTCFTFITTYLDLPKNNFWFKINLTIGLFFSILSLTTKTIVSGVIHYQHFPYPEAGILHPLLICHCAYLSFSCIKLLIEALRKETTTRKQRSHLKYMLFAILILSVGMVDFLMNYHIEFHEIGPITTAIYLILTTIAIIRHQLMDINIVLRKSLIYSFLISLITLCFIFIVILCEKLSQNLIGYNNHITSLILSFFIALIFIPLKNKIQEFVDRTFFNNTQFEIVEENEKLRKEIIKSERHKAVAILASGLAHEIKNPLTALSTFADHVPQKINDPGFIEQYQKIVPNELRRINNLINDLLTFAKPCPLELQSLNPNDIILSLHQMLTPTLNLKHIDFVTHFNTTTEIQADPNQLKQALLNLILNAIDAMPNGGKLTISTESHANHYTIKISDTGHGIDPKEAKDIFEPFYSKKKAGTGLGLAITKEIIEKHGGKISVKNSSNNGVSFLINL